jgi:hypothetical protein
MAKRSVARAETSPNLQNLRVVSQTSPVEKVGNWTKRKTYQLAQGKKQQTNVSMETTRIGIN